MIPRTAKLLFADDGNPGLSSVPVLILHFVFGEQPFGEANESRGWVAFQTSLEQRFGERLLQQIRNHVARWDAFDRVDLPPFLLSNNLVPLRRNLTRPGTTA
ncbi:MAG: hypothetical protein JO091_14690 [Acidobacteriaceae bacterium]|nr:hypothetical protein [Acidobacteriaceae bacterium]